LDVIKPVKHGEGERSEMLRNNEKNNEKGRLL
jgi:hypothetical protein